jgi:hypothetical protein
MRVSPRDLRGIRAEGLLTRFAILGPVAFVSVEVPASGSTGTSVERPTENAAWGIVLNGSVTLHGATEESFGRGTAFHVPGGTPEHWFSTSGRAVIAGFAPMEREVDTSDAGIRALGYEPVARMPAPAPPPAVIAPAGGGSIFRAQGTIEVESAQMGDWVFARTTYGPLSGYTSGWCDLPHWGMVLSGDLALRFEDSLELLSAGDVYYCPAGPPGHQFQVADAATTIDYTPVADLFAAGRKSEWRAAAARRLGQGESVSTTQTGGAGLKAGARGRRSAEPQTEASAVPEDAAIAVRRSGFAAHRTVHWVRRGLLRQVRAGTG